jgi:hypothetical protein
VKEADFWRPPLWKWAVFLLLVTSSARLLLYREPRHPVVEPIAASDTHPTWDGSSPYLTICVIDPESVRVTVKTFIQLIKPTTIHTAPINEFQVDLHSGMFVLRQTDLFISDINPLSLTRTYRVWDLHIRGFGVGTNHPYDICPTGDRFPYTHLDVNLEDGRQIHFGRVSAGTGYADAAHDHNAVRRGSSHLPNRRCR